MASPPGSDLLARRAFLARIGVLGAVATSPGLLAQAAYADPDTQAMITSLDRILGELSRDTLNGLAAFVMPGPDAYSRAQGTWDRDPGALDARTPDFLIGMFDRLISLPAQIARPLARAFASGLDDLALPIPPDLRNMPDSVVGNVDKAFSFLLKNDVPIPLTSVVALLLNLLATQVNPVAIRGPFFSPFARLSFHEKTQVFRLLEEADSKLVALIDSQISEPLRHTTSGVLKFFGGGLPLLVAVGAYSEWAVFDPKTKQLSGRPVGWQVTGYTPSVDGWDDFKGYYQGRTKAEG